MRIKSIATEPCDIRSRPTSCALNTSLGLSLLSWEVRPLFIAALPPLFVELVFIDGWPTSAAPSALTACAYVALSVSALWTLKDQWTLMRLRQGRHPRWVLADLVGSRRLVRQRPYPRESYRAAGQGRVVGVLPPLQPSAASTGKRIATLVLLSVIVVFVTFFSLAVALPCE